MTSQADRLLIHGDLVRKNGSFRQNPAFVDGGVGQNLFQLVFQAGAVVDHRLAAAGFHLGNQFQNGLAPAAQVVLQGLALGGAHGIIACQCLIHNAHKIAQQLLFIHIRLFHREHVRHPGKQGHADIVAHAIVRGHLAHGTQVPFHHGGVQGDLHILGSFRTHGDEHIHLAPGNRALHCLLDGVLRKGQRPGQLYGAVQVTVVYGAQLYGKLPTVYGFHRPAVAGHTLNHDCLPLFWQSPEPFPRMP